MSWLAYGATVPLEINWPSGIVATSAGLAACVACLLLIGLAARAFGRFEGKGFAEVALPVEMQDRPRPAAA
jgi:hypothetical protein